MVSSIFNGSQNIFHPAEKKAATNPFDILNPEAQQNGMSFPEAVSAVEKSYQAQTDGFSQGFGGSNYYSSQDIRDNSRYEGSDFLISPFAEPQIYVRTETAAQQQAREYLQTNGADIQQIKTDFSTPVLRDLKEGKEGAKANATNPYGVSFAGKDEDLVAVEAKYSLSAELGMIPGAVLHSQDPNAMTNYEKDQIVHVMKLLDQEAQLKQQYGEDIKIAYNGTRKRYEMLRPGDSGYDQVQTGTQVEQELSKTFDQGYLDRKDFQDIFKRFNRWL